MNAEEARVAIDEIKRLLNKHGLWYQVSEKYKNGTVDQILITDVSVKIMKK